MQRVAEIKIILIFSCKGGAGLSCFEMSPHKQMNTTTPSLTQIEQARRIAAANAYAAWKKEPSLENHLIATCAITESIYDSETLADAGGAVSLFRIRALKSAMDEINASLKSQPTPPHPALPKRSGALR